MSPAVPTRPEIDLFEFEHGWRAAAAGLDLAWLADDGRPRSPFRFGHGLYHAAQRSRRERAAVFPDRSRP